MRHRARREFSAEVEGPRRKGDRPAGRQQVCSKVWAGAGAGGAGRVGLQGCGPSVCAACSGGGCCLCECRVVRRAAWRRARWAAELLHWKHQPPSALAGGGARAAGRSGGLAERWQGCWFGKVRGSTPASAHRDGTERRRQQQATPHTSAAPSSAGAGARAQARRSARAVWHVMWRAAWRRCARRQGAWHLQGGALAGALGIWVDWEHPRRRSSKRRAARPPPAETTASKQDAAAQHSGLRK